MSEFSKQRTFGPSPRYERVEHFARRDDEAFTVISGPCSVESADQINRVAKMVSAFGATHLRGGVFRAGTYPGSSFGYIEQALIREFSQAGRENGLKVVIEVLDYREPYLSMVCDYADVLQVGCRQMQNYTLLREVGLSGKPVLVKRHPGATIDEFLGAAEHVLTANPECDLKLIERGSATNARHVRWDLSISMIPAVQQITEIPIIVDASHGTGRRDLVESMTCAGVAAGADGILVEVHPEPEKSLSDAEQAVTFDTFMSIMYRVNRIRKIVEPLKEPPCNQQ